MEETERFEITIYTTIINHWRTNNKDAALNRIRSMVGKIKFRFADLETGFKKVINDYEDYQTLIENYEVKDNESTSIQKAITYNKDISG